MLRKFYLLKIIILFLEEFFLSVRLYGINIASKLSHSKYLTENPDSASDTGTLRLDYTLELNI